MVLLHAGAGVGIALARISAVMVSLSRAGRLEHHQLSLAEPLGFSGMAIAAIVGTAEMRSLWHGCISGPGVSGQLCLVVSCWCLSCVPLGCRVFLFIFSLYFGLRWILYCSAYFLCN